MFAKTYPDIEASDEDEILKKIAFREVYCTEIYHQMSTDAREKLDELRTSGDLEDLEEVLDVDDASYLVNRKIQG